MKKTLKSLIFVVALFGFFAPRAFAEFDSTPTIFPTEGSVINSIVPTSSKMFVGGDVWKFTSLANPLIPSGGDFVDPSTSLASTTFAQSNDVVYAAVPDGNGGWFIGGGFTKVSGATHNALAHILPSGAVDSAFTASVTGVGPVLSMVLSPDKSTLYIAGTFTTVDGISRPRLAAVSATDGSLISAFNPAPNGINVFSMAISTDGTSLYAVGDFTSIGGQAISRLAELNTSDGTAVVAFNPAPSAQVNQVVFAPDHSVLYVGGNFTTIGGQSRNGLAAVSTTTGAATSFDPNANTSVGVYSMVPSSDGTILYVGGTFTNIGGQSRTRIAALNTSDGTATSFNPTAGAVVRMLLLSPDGTKLYASGDFSTIGGQTRPEVASFNTSDGSITSFNPRVDFNDSAILAVAPDGTPFLGKTNFFGGEYFNANGTGLSDAAYSLTNDDLLYKAPTVDNQVLTQTLSADGTTLYVGGWFNTIGGATHHFIAAVDPSDGSIKSGFTASTDDIVYQIMPSADGSILYISGRFTLVDGVSHSRIAAINASDGSLVTSFTPTADDGVQAMQFSSDKSVIYIAGDFLNVDGVARNRMAAINTSDGSLVAGFNPNLTGAARALALSPDGATLYVSGSFTKVGATTRNRIAAINTSDGSLVAGFDPNANGLVRNIVLNSDGSRLYAAGQFTTIGGNSVPALASISTANGSVNTSFTQSILTAGLGLAISSDSSKLFVSQSQSQALTPNGYVPILMFTDPSIIPTTKPTLTTSAASSITATGATLNGNITATGGTNPTTRGFVYGASASYGATTTESGSFSTGAYTGAVSSLTCNTTYHFAAYATNTAGTGYGSDTTFTTSACASGGGGSGNNGGGGAILSAGAAGSSGHHFGITLPPASTSTPVLASPPSLIVFPNTNVNASFNSGNPKSNSSLALANAPGQTKKKTTPNPVPAPTSTPPEPTSTPIQLIGEPTTTPTTTPELVVATETPGIIPAVISGIIAFVSFVGSALGRAVPVLASGALHVVAPIVAVSDAAVRLLPGATKVLPALIPILPALTLLSTQLADVFAAGVPLTDSVAAYFTHFVDVLLSFFGIKRRRNHLGTIFDSSTGSPVSLAYVTLHEASTGERVSVSVSDASGAYGFLIKPGSYIMRVAKSGYAFPSRENLALSFAGVYTNVYQGEVIEVTDEAAVVGRNVGLDRIRAATPKYLNRAWKQAYNILGTIIFAAGFISSIHSLILNPGVGTLLMIIVYIVIFAISLLHTREWGRVYERRTGKLLQGLLVELYTRGYGERVIDRAVTDARGRFFIHSPKGEYAVKVFEFGHAAPVLNADVYIGKDGVVNDTLSI